MICFAIGHISTQVAVFDIKLDSRDVTIPSPTIAPTTLPRPPTFSPA